MWTLIIDVATVITERRLKRDSSSVRAIWPSRYKDSGLDEKGFVLVEKKLSRMNARRRVNRERENDKIASASCSEKCHRHWSS
jgi:hypothetical protein